jgi:hypothetical protein
MVLSTLGRLPVGFFMFYIILHLTIHLLIECAKMRHGKEKKCIHTYILDTDSMRTAACFTS